MSKIEEIKKLKRKQKMMSPTEALMEVVEEDIKEEKKVSTNEEKNETINEVSNTETNETKIVENNGGTKEENKELSSIEIKLPRKEGNKVERKRVSFDLRTDLHKELKLQALLQEKNIYILIEEALEQYLHNNKQ